MHVVHPEPERRLERDHGVLRHRVRVPEPVEADVPPGGPVVVVPRDLQRAAPVVLLPRRARPLPVVGVAVAVALVDLADVAEVCMCFTSSGKRNKPCIKKPCKLGVTI